MPLQCWPHYAAALPTGLELLLARSLAFSLALACQTGKPALCKGSLMQVLEDPERATERLSETRQETDLVSRRGLQQASSKQGRREGHRFQRLWVNWSRESCSPTGDNSVRRPPPPPAQDSATGWPGNCPELSGVSKRSSSSKRALLADWRSRLAFPAGRDAPWTPWLNSYPAKHGLGPERSETCETPAPRRSPVCAVLPCALEGVAAAMSAAQHSKSSKPMPGCRALSPEALRP